ncbi:MAG: SUMF1/EgtB/PvdO family nonheme iron enzyme [Reyranellaceae bacterium]
MAAHQAAAQPRESTAGAWPQRFYNPQPLIDDVELPMPCGGTMVFRRIDVLREGADSRRIVIGGDDPRFQYAEASREEFVEGAFTDRGDPKRRYFFMAKYEITELQHAALNGDCRTPTRESLKPAVRVTWFDAVQAAQRYTEWLLQNARDKLPREGNAHGFLRLPTEAEWEFAARGGIEVTPEQFEAPTFPMTDGIEKYVWFRSTRSSNSELQIVGALKPNPLGLHDILGNADEIILESFRLYRAGGARGQSGGYVVKGGNYQTPEGDVRSSYRHEIAPYDDQGPRRVPTVSYRLALVAAVIPSRERLEELKRAAAAKPQPAPPAQAAPKPAEPPPPPAVTVTPEAMEYAAWSAIVDTTDPQVLEAFLKRFPDGVYAGIARARLAELRARAAREEEARRAAAAEDARRREDEARRRAQEEARQAAERVEQALALDEPTRRRAQIGLAQKGFDPGPPDGVFGPQTRQMIARYQQSRGEPQTGYLTRPQAEALVRDARPPPPVAMERQPPESGRAWVATYLDRCWDSCGRINERTALRIDCRMLCNCNVRNLTSRFSPAELDEVAQDSFARRRTERVMQYRAILHMCMNLARH